MENEIMGTPNTVKYEPLSHKEYPNWVISLDRIARRILDVIVSFFGLIALNPIFFVIGTIIKRDTTGPVFYHGPRVGKNDKIFKILKFRTMYENPESYNGKRLTVNGDPRVTEAGRWLRDSKLNELPQLWNVLLGQMSLVGPRPEDPQIFEDWPEEFKAEYLKVRPGITSPASLMFFDEENRISTSNTEKDYLINILPFKLRIDFNYLAHRTIINDLDILFMTFIALFPQIRKKRIRETTLDKGPLISLFYGFFNWFLIDFAIAIIATSLAILVWRLSNPLDIGAANAFALACLLAIGFSLTNVIFGLNRIAWRHAPGEAIIDLGISTMIAVLMIAIFDAFFSQINIPLVIKILAGMLAFLGFSITRYRERILTGIASRWLNLRGSANRLGERVIIIGAGDLGVKTSWYIRHGYLKKMLNVVGFVDDNVYKDNLIIDESPVLGGSSDLPDLVKKHHIDILIFAIDRISAYRRRKIEAICQQTGAQTINARDLPNTMGAVIGLEQPYEGLFLSSDEAEQFLDQLDHHLVKNDIAAARELINQARASLNNEEKESFE